MTRLIKVVKRKQRPAKELLAKVALVSSRNRWSSFGSWVSEFRNRDRIKSLPAFNSLFKDELPENDSPNEG